MKPSSINDVVKLPSELERQQIFYWLKKLSSLTAWRRIFEYYQAWAEVTEKSVRQADNNGIGDDTSLPLTEYALILKCLAHCEEGVILLSKGDKRIFKFDSNGEFIMAMRMLTHWSQMLQRIELGENGIKKGTPCWVDFCEALTALAEAWGECGPQILEARYLEDPAPTLYGQWLQNELAKTPFPAQLAPVPDPVDNVFVRTGKQLPCSGIWEPVGIPKPSILNLLTRPPKPQPPFAIQGCMNYLHAGSNAPKMTIVDPEFETVV
ncbi:Imm71 family immunity protein [Duganella sp.]|uniref:Imm71 family immunity protein n=1 Tax=Duganella sp. TaxID=1904440 RepID=UPI0031D45B61